MEVEHETLVCRRKGLFGDVLVLDQAGRRHLRFGTRLGVDQSIVDLRHPHVLPVAYLRAATLAAMIPSRLGRVLLVGLGGGGFIRFLRLHFPRLPIDVVEIDPAVVAVARRYFGVREDSRLRIHLEDALTFLEALASPRHGYDFILLDAYSGAKIPVSLTSHRFFASVRAALSTCGVVAANVGVSERAAEQILRCFHEVFGTHCFRLPVPEEDNRIVVGARQPLPNAREIVALARRIDAEGRFYFSLARIARLRRKLAS
jgi:spermidine synthase